MENESNAPTSCGPYGPKVTLPGKYPDSPQSCIDYEVNDKVRFELDPLPSQFPQLSIAKGLHKIGLKVIENLHLSKHLVPTYKSLV